MSQPTFLDLGEHLLNPAHVILATVLSPPPDGARVACQLVLSNNADIILRDAAAETLLDYLRTRPAGQRQSD